MVLSGWRGRLLLLSCGLRHGMRRSHTWRCSCWNGTLPMGCCVCCWCWCCASCSLLATSAGRRGASACIVAAAPRATPHSKPAAAPRAYPAREPMAGLWAARMEAGSAAALCCAASTPCPLQAGLCSRTCTAPTCVKPLLHRLVLAGLQALAVPGVVVLLAAHPPLAAQPLALVAAALTPVVVYGACHLHTVRG